MHPTSVQPAKVAISMAMATIPIMIVGVKLLCGDGPSDGGGGRFCSTSRVESVP